MTRQTGLVAPCFPSCRVPKDTAPTTNPSDKTLEEAKDRKYDSIIKRSVPIPNLFTPHEILKLSFRNRRDPLIPVTKYEVDQKEIAYLD